MNNAEFHTNDDTNIIHDETKMFDNDQTTFWRSNGQYKSENKIIGVEFKVIFFLSLSWFNRQFEIDDETVRHCLGTY